MPKLAKVGGRPRARAAAGEATAPFETISATDAKNSFGAVLDRVATQGRVGISKHDEVRAVVLSIQEYRALLANQYDPLRELRDEFDTWVDQMQTPRARAAGHALFDASTAELGRASVAGAKKRG